MAGHIRNSAGVNAGHGMIYLPTGYSLNQGQVADGMT